MRYALIATALMPLLTACDSQVSQTVVVQANIANPAMNSLWLVEADQCTGKQIRPELYRNGLWIFSLSSTRGGIGVVTQELALCHQGAASSPPTKIWHILHGGGAPFIILSCDGTSRQSCALYMDRHAEGDWHELPK